MRETRLLMGMSVTVEIVDEKVTVDDLEKVYQYFTRIDETFSTYKPTSEISRINAGLLPPEQWSSDMHYVLAQCEQTKQETQGFFNISRQGYLDPSGYVKGWALQNAVQQLKDQGFKHFYLEIGGDLQVVGQNTQGEAWVIGIRNPFKPGEIIKRLILTNAAVATSGTSMRGQHIYNPHRPDQAITEIVSLTVVGPHIVDADRFATAAFAMGSAGINFIASLENYEGYMIDSEGIATFTPGFNYYLVTK